MLTTANVDAMTLPQLDSQLKELRHDEEIVIREFEKREKESVSYVC